MADRPWAFIPAKAVSRRLPGKNLAEIGGVSLVARAVQVALDSGLFSYVIVSTDCREIGAEALRAGGEIVPRFGPCCIEQEVGHVLAHWLEREPSAPSAVCLLLPTAPLRTPKHLVESFGLLTGSAEIVMSVTPITQDFRYALHVVEGRAQRAVSEWRLPPGPYYVHDGTVLWIRRDRARIGALYGPGVVPYHVPPEESCDVNTPWDLAQARARLEPALP